MTTLYLDTSSSYLYAGLASVQGLIEECQVKLDKELSSFSLPEIEKLFSKSKLSPKDVDKIIVVDGPGSFTGIRIGVTIAKTYAWAFEKEITTISSLEAMALSVTGYDYLIPVLDARHNCVFGGIYQQDGQAILANGYLELETLIKKVNQLSAPFAWVTNDDLSLEGPVENYHPDILKIVNYFKSKSSIHPHAVEPHYLKKTEAEESKLSDERN